jgi:outer membrane immunogenic protein
MKRMLIGMTTVASLLATSALAADLPMRTYTKAPVFVEPIFNWTGFYVGGNIGYSWGRSSDSSTLTNTAGTVLFASTGTTDLNGVVGGGQIGYNWQIQNWLWGFEADIQGTNEKGSRNFVCAAGICIPTPPAILAPVTGTPVPATLSQKIDWFGTVRGRAGVLVTPTLLLYATGGLAYGEVDSGATIGLTPTVFPSTTATHAGWTVGGGIEGVIGGNWTARLEYLYVDLGRVSGSFLTTIVPVGGGVLSANYSSRVTDNIVRVGINYKFNSPVVANY